MTPTPSSPQFRTQPRRTGTAQARDLRSDQQTSTNPLDRTAGALKPEWILIALPTALAIKNFYVASSGITSLLILGAFAAVNGMLVVVAYARKPEHQFALLPGPLIAILASSAIVLSRPSGIQNVIVFLLVTALAFQLARTIDARRIIRSLIDGIGLYLLLNVAGYLLGIRSATESEGWRLYLSGGGVSRIIFPLEQRLNLPPVLAAVYIAAIYFLIKEPGWRRRLARVLCLCAAIFVIVGSGTRVPAVVAVLLPIMAILFPKGSRWIAPASVALAAASPVLLPRIVSSMQAILDPLVAAVSGRQDSYRSLAALNGRDYVWEKAITFWQDEIDSIFNILVGYGMYGHYKSGVSLVYYRLLSHVIVRDPEKTITVHNSFLQQLFDAGVVGWLLLTVALFWASVRLAKRIDILGPYATAATMAISVIVLCAMTEVLLHPTIITFFVVLILVTAACQATPESGANAPTRPYERESASGHSKRSTRSF